MGAVLINKVDMKASCQCTTDINRNMSKPVISLFFKSDTYVFFLSLNKQRYKTSNYVNHKI